MSRELLQKQQEVLKELWQVFDKICRENEIPYMLFAGTALGAVRDQGIIPWDDDLDVVMYRTDYERFLETAPIYLDQEKYYLQKEFSDHWPMFFSKLRKNNTAFMERQIPKDPKMHQGVYIDIFPCDNLLENPFLRKLQFYASKVVIAKSLDKRGYLTDSKVKKLFMFCSRILPLNPLHRFVVQRGKEDSKMVHTFFGAAKKYEKNIYPREWFKEYVRIPFSGCQAPVSAYYDQLLTKLYGDYMTPLPPEEQVYKVHAEIVDLEHSYEQYLEVQKNTKYTVYTKSIR